jgi:hypothetical protein
MALVLGDDQTTDTGKKQALGIIIVMVLLHLIYQCALALVAFNVLPLPESRSCDRCAYNGCV